MNASNTEKSGPTPETHPAIKFWTKSDWETWKKKAQNHRASNTSYLEDQNGKPLTTKRTRDIRTTMRSVWEDLARDRLAPSSWGRATVTARQRMRDIMYREWPLLTLCNDGWKLDDLASITYPGWKRSYLNLDGTLIGKETVDDAQASDNDNNNNNTMEKRKRSSNIKSECNQSVACKRTKSILYFCILICSDICFHPKHQLLTLPSKMKTTLNLRWNPLQMYSVTTNAH